MNRLVHSQWMGLSLLALIFIFLSCGSSAERDEQRESARRAEEIARQSDSRPSSQPADTSGTPKNSDAHFSASGHDLTPISDADADAMAEQYDDLTQKVTRRAGTERARTGAYWDNKEQGIYLCRICGLPLYDAKTKFVSGTGWPSFWEAVDSAHIATDTDYDLGDPRTEVHCARCESHLGHIFNDAPLTPTGKRHCINSVSLLFIKDGAELPERSKPARKK